MFKSLVYLNVQKEFAEKSYIFGFFDVYLDIDRHLVIGLSGGPDSMFLSRCIVAYYHHKGWNINNLTFVHGNHRQRKESDQEVVWISEFFDGFDVRVREYPGEKSSESVLRKRRHEQFELVLGEYQNPFLCLGHNLTDRIETTFLNLARGAGIEGFLNMEIIDQKKSYIVLRPLLFLSKDRIQELCEQCDIPYLIDPTNADPEISDRNFLRTTILPQLYTLGQGKFVESMYHLYTLLESQKTTSSLTITPLVISPYWGITKGYLVQVGETWTIGSVIECFKYFEIYRDVSEVLLKEWLIFLNSGIDGRKHFKGKMFVKAHEKTYVFDALKPFWEEYLDHQVKIDTLGEIMLGKEKVDITDKQCIGGILRYPLEGDTYGSKNLSKALLNYKIPVFWRRMVPIVEKEGKIIAFLMPQILVSE